VAAAEGEMLIVLRDLIDFPWVTVASYETISSNTNNGISLNERIAKTPKVNDWVQSLETHGAFEVVSRRRMYSEKFLRDAAKAIQQKESVSENGKSKNRS
jgi:hypothetical protein